MFISAEIRTDNRDTTGVANFVIVHRFWKSETDCLAGEEVVGIWLEIADREVQLPLPLALRLLFDHLARHRWLAESSAQIEASMRSDPFYLRHAANSHSSRKLTRRMSRSGIKVYITRIRQALQLAFDEAEIPLKPTDVLVSEQTVATEVRYRLRAKVRFVHIP